MGLRKFFAKFKPKRTKEIGTATPTGGYHGYQRLNDTNIDLRFPRNIAVYNKMLKEDEQVSMAYSACTLPVLRAKWHIDSNGADPEVVERVAQDLKLPILGVDSPPVTRLSRGVSWQEHLPQALLALVFGFAYFEQVYEQDETGWHLVKLAPRWADTISKINVDENGNLESIEQKSVRLDDGTKLAPVIPVDSLVGYVYRPTNSDWMGTSILRPCYRPWRLKDELQRLQLKTLERNGMGIPVYVASKETLLGRPEDLQDEIDRGQELVEAIRADDFAGVSIPPGASFEFKGVSGQLPDVSGAIKSYNDAIAKSVLAHFLNLDDGGGSYALADTQSSFFTQSLQTIADWVALTAQKYIVEDLISLAFPDYKGPVPLINCDPIASNSELKPEMWPNAVAAGLVDPNDPVTRKYFHRKMQIPWSGDTETNNIDNNEGDVLL